MSADLKWVDPHTVVLERLFAPHELELRIPVYIHSAKHNLEWTRELLGLLAGLLRLNQLPKSGREYLAAELEKIARGGDPRALLPPRRKQKKYSPIDVLVAVEREKLKRGQKQADSSIFDRVGRQFGIRGSTAAKETSIGLSSFREEMLGSGEEFDKVLEMATERLELPLVRVLEFLFRTPIQKVSCGVHASLRTLTKESNLVMRTFLKRREAANYLTERGLKTSWRTLQKKASTGGGPPYRIYGNQAVYEPPHLDEWADNELTPIRRSTSEIPDAKRRPRNDGRREEQQIT